MVTRRFRADFEQSDAKKKHRHICHWKRRRASDQKHYHRVSRAQLQDSYVLTLCQFTRKALRAAGMIICYKTQKIGNSVPAFFIPFFKIECLVSSLIPWPVFCIVVRLFDVAFTTEHLQVRSFCFSAL